MVLQSVHIRHPRTSHRIRNNSQNIFKKLELGKKREETFRRATEEDPSLQNGQKQ